MAKRRASGKGGKRLKVKDLSAGGKAGKRVKGGGTTTTTLSTSTSLQKVGAVGPCFRVGVIAPCDRL